MFCEEQQNQLHPKAEQPLKRKPCSHQEHLKTHGKGPAIVAVLCALLADKTQDDDGVNEALQINAASTLLSDSSPLAMRRMRELPHLFVGIPHESTVPKVIGLIRDNIGNTDKTANDIVGTAAAVLTAIMQNCKADLESLVQLIAEELVQIESSTQSADLVGKVCGSFGGQWRRSLLEDTSVSVEKYGLVLESVGNAMMQHPKHSACLLLFGNLVPNSSQQGHVERIQRGVFRISKLSVEALERQKEATTNIFDRLAPLLLLRRTPSFLLRRMRLRFLICHD